MQSQSDPPIILLATVNGASDRRAQKLLDQESRMIETLFARQQQPAPFEIVREDPESGVFVVDQLKKYAFNDRVAVLHLAGYGSSDVLRFRGARNAEVLKNASIGPLVGQFPGLQMVFLNGCGSPELMESILLQDVPVVTASYLKSGNRRYAQEIAHTFYAGLAKGQTIRHTLKRVAHDYPNRFANRLVSYDFQTDQLDWAGKAKMNGHGLPWGGYVLQENEPRLSWKLPIQALPPEPLKERSLPTEESENTSRLARLIGSGILLCGMILAALFLLDIPKRFFAAADLPQDCVFEEVESYNVLTLPFTEGGNCIKTDPRYAETIEGRIASLADQNTYPESDFQIQRFTTEACAVPEGLAERMITYCKADLVLWGNYEMVAEGGINMNFEYLYQSKGEVVKRGATSLYMEEGIFLDSMNFMSSSVEDMVFRARGLGHYDRGEYEEAVRFLSRMRVTEDAAYLAIADRLARSFAKIKDYPQAQAQYDWILKNSPENHIALNERGNTYVFMKDYDQALLDFNDAIRISPEYADAYYNRGLVLFHLDRYEEAIDDMKQVLQLNSEAAQQAKPYGVLAAIYAEQRERELFFSHLELALKNGLKIESFIYYYSAFRAYRSDPAFKELVVRYK
ncbi:MAG: tetratricopeptide repeat protein [Bacteroidota bacterium]